MFLIYYFKLLLSIIETAVCISYNSIDNAIYKNILINWMLKVSKWQSFKVAKFQRAKVSKSQSFKVPKCQRAKESKSQRAKEPKSQRVKELKKLLNTFATL